MSNVAICQTECKSVRANNLDDLYNSRRSWGRDPYEAGVNIVIENTDTFPRNQVDEALVKLIDFSSGAIDLKPEELKILTLQLKPLLTGARELRDQFYAEKVTVKASYPGRRAGVDPFAFLMENYGEEIADGRFGPGQLALRDSRLYTAIRDGLPKLGAGLSMQEYFESKLTKASLGEGGKPRFQRRVWACAELLGAPTEKAAAFFGTLRQDRVRVRRETEGQRER